MSKSTKQQAVEMMIESYPRPVNRNEFLQRFLYTFRNRLSEMSLHEEIHYNSELAKKSQYVFSSDEDYLKAVEKYGGSKASFPKIDLTNASQARLLTFQS